MGKAKKRENKKSPEVEHSPSLGEQWKHQTHSAIHSKVAKKADRSMIGLEHMLGSLEKHEGKWAKYVAYGALAVALTAAFATGVGEGAVAAGAAAAEVGGLVGEVAELASLATTATTATEETAAISSAVSEGSSLARGGSTLARAGKTLAIGQLATAVSHDTIHAINHAIDEDKKYAHRIYRHHHPEKVHPELPDTPSLLPEIEYALSSGQTPTAVEKYISSLIGISSLPPQDRAARLVSMGFTYVDRLSSKNSMTVIAPNGQPYVFFPSDSQSTLSERDKKMKLEIAQNLLTEVGTYTNRTDTVAIGVDNSDYLAQNAQAPGGSAVYTGASSSPSLPPSNSTLPATNNPPPSAPHETLINPYGSITKQSETPSS